ncbi:MAG: ATP-binding protein [Clostridiales bacterium]|jgi:anti-sigma regulatory factor (Ser/Thr protein kinase)|nr:ATP-binding protein [Clostridiales bacterium]
MKHLTVQAKIESLEEVIDFIQEEMSYVAQKIVNQISIVVEEIFANIANYAYPYNGGMAEISVDTTNDVLTMSFEDSGEPYNPLEKDDPDITLSAEMRDIGGLGIFMAKKLSDSISYNYKDGKNILTITKNICRNG